MQVGKQLRGRGCSCVIISTKWTTQTMNCSSKCTCMCGYVVQSSFIFEHNYKRLRLYPLWITVFVVVIDVWLRVSLFYQLWCESTSRSLLKCDSWCWTISWLIHCYQADYVICSFQEWLRAVAETESEYLLYWATCKISQTEVSHWSMEPFYRCTIEFSITLV